MTNRRLLRPHWTPRYVYDRGRLAIRGRRFPDEPWLTATAIEILDSWLRPSDRCLEWGSGRSTRWLAARVAEVRSVEHDPEWAARVRSSVAGHPGVDVRLAGPDPQSYVAAASGVDDVDLALIDGIHRDQCALLALDLLAPGGLLVVDNVERYLPSSSRSPEAIGDHYDNDGWRTFAERTATWRRIWTTNGVTDTALFVRPLHSGSDVAGPVS